MKFKYRAAPHISYPDNSRLFMINVIIVLLIIYGMSFFFYGARALVLGLVGILSSFITDWICLLIFSKRPSIHDFSAIVTGLLIPLLLPASIPFYVVILASVFAIGVVKHPFGGVGHNIFNPAAGGIAFVATCFPASVMFSYPLPLTKVPMFPVVGELLTVNSPTFTLSVEGVPNYLPVNMALGNFPGPMGATNILVLLACLLFLISRKTLKWQTPVFFLVTAAAFAAVFPRVPVSPIESVIYELMSGIILFGAVFMLGDPVTTPKRSWASAAYGAVAAIIIMLFRYNAKIEDSFVFALLLMNSLVWGFDNLSEHLAHILRRRTYAKSTE